MDRYASWCSHSLGLARIGTCLLIPIILMLACGGQPDADERAALRTTAAPDSATTATATPTHPPQSARSETPTSTKPASTSPSPTSPSEAPSSPDWQVTASATAVHTFEPTTLIPVRSAACPLVTPAAADPYSTIRVASIDGDVEIIASLPEDEVGRPAPASVLRWSPDGERLALTVWDRSVGEHVICVLEADGSAVLGFTLGGRAQEGVAHDELRFGLDWSPDGRWLALSSEGEIYVVAADGDGVLRVTDDDIRDFGPVWSPNGRYLAFTADPPGPASDPNAYDTRVVVADLSNPAAIVERGGWPGRYPAWLPDGRVVHSAPGNNGDFLAVGVPGDLQAEVLIYPELSAWYPVPSPDGRFVAYTAFNLDGPGTLMVLDIESGEIETIVEATGQPGWSPDGSRFVVALGNVLHVITPGAWEADPLLDSRVSADGVWSPDGSRIAVMTWGEKNLPGGN